MNHIKCWQLRGVDWNNVILRVKQNWLNWKYTHSPAIFTWIEIDKFPVPCHTHFTGFKVKSVCSAWIYVRTMNKISFWAKSKQIIATRNCISSKWNLWKPVCPRISASYSRWVSRFSISASLNIFSNGIHVRIRLPANDIYHAAGISRQGIDGEVFLPRNGTSLPQIAFLVIPWFSSFQLGSHTTLLFNFPQDWKVEIYWSFFLLCCL